jgi:PAS domain S-box-containing protein
MVYAFFLALPWASIAVLHLGALAQDEELILVALGVGMAASGTILLSAVPAAAFSYMSGILIPTAVKCLVLLNQKGYLLLGVLALSYWGFLAALIAKIMREISEREKADAALEENAARLQEALTAGQVVAFTWEPGTGLSQRSENASQVLGLEAKEDASGRADDFLACVHPEDRARFAARIRSLCIENPSYSTSFRFICPDGHEVWLEETGKAEFDPTGRYWRVKGLTRDITGQKRAEEGLQASKDRLQLALDAARLGWWRYDPRHRVFSGDMRSQKIFDVAESQTPIEEIMKRVHPDDLESVLAALDARLNPVGPKRSATEFRLQCGDSEVRWVETLGLAYFEGDGRERRAVSVVGIVQDITERKEREEKEQFLIREINHRAKNMLSVVHAIARQTVSRNPEDFIERFSERIQALSANQDLLVRNEWKGVEIEGLVRAQLALFADLFGSRIAVHGAKLSLKAAAAQAIGLALHELSTNAGKYGALSTGMGRVEVRWGTDGDTFIMSWTEHNGPPVSALGRRGFGTIVMEAMTQRSVDGTVDLDYALSGVTWRLTCPAANALEPGRM